MTPLVTLRIALRALRRHKMRSFLTTLGIVIGVGAVIAMMAIGEGAKARVEATFAAMGTNMLVLETGSFRGGGMHGGAGSAQTITWEDVAAIRAEVPSVKLVAPEQRLGTVLVSDEQNWSCSVQGTGTEYFLVRNWSISEGAFFTEADVESGAKVVLLGQTASDMLFGPAVNPIGRLVRIKKAPFQVIGVLAKKGQSPGGTDYDDVAIVPISAFQRKIQGGLQNYVSGHVYISAVSLNDTARAVSQITALLRERHRLAADAPDDFSIRNLAEFASAQEESTKTLTLLLASIAAVSLIVGGIGIMNIMLVSVTERTREIGLRMAVGAKPRHILSQFLVEAIVLSLTGGVIGVGVGIIAARWIAAEADWPVLFSVNVVAIAVGFSAVVGIAFGLYPASRAARLDPIEALRYE